MDAQLDPIFQAAIDSQRVPGVCAAALDGTGKPLFNKGYGNTVFGDPSSPKVDTDTPAMIWSCTKLIASIACLQLIEQGKVNLDDSVEKYVPEIRQIKLLEGFNEDGSPILREPKNEIKILHLFTHTSGMAYDFFDPANTLKYRISQNLPLVSYVTHSAKHTYTDPLIFEPGTAYSYGPNNDWMGFVVEKVTGLSLAEYIDKHIVQPLGLKNTGLTFPPDQGKTFMTVHAKDSTGALTPTETKLASPAEVPCPGGHYLYSTALDYANILVALVNDGKHPVSGAQILKPETCRDLVFKDQIPRVGCSPAGIGVIPTGSLPPASCEGEFLPGINKGWSCGLMMNHEDVPNGRPAGSGSWAGLGNCYYWADPKNKVVGMVIAAILPFFDRDVLHLADALERAVYQKPQAKDIGELGSNFSGGVNINQPQPAESAA